VLSQGEPRDAAVKFSIRIEFYNGIVRFLCHNMAFLNVYIIDRSNAEITTHSTLTFRAVMQTHGDSQMPESINQSKQIYI